MKSILLILMLFLNGTLLAGSVSALIPKQKNLSINNQGLNRHKLLTKQNLQLSPEQALIIGRWRGFRETPDFTVYYGYEFRSNGVYVARHRVYQQEKTILDQYWQGKWNFDGKILRLEGTFNKEKDKLYKYNFRLDQDDLLYYQDGDLPEPYLPGKMGKIG